METLDTIEWHRETWAKIARDNGWYSEPFFVQVWRTPSGRILDSVSSRILTADVVIDEPTEYGLFCSEWCVIDAYSNQLAPVLFTGTLTEYNRAIACQECGDELPETPFTGS